MCFLREVTLFQVGVTSDPLALKAAVVWPQCESLPVAYLTENSFGNSKEQSSFTPGYQNDLLYWGLTATLNTSGRDGNRQGCGEEKAAH